MNKKKFFATATLVAFGASMIPAFAFAFATPTNEFYNGSNKFVDALNGTGKVVNAQTAGEVSWLSDDDTLSVMYLPENKLGVPGTDVSSKFKIKAGTASKGSDAKGKGDDSDDDNAAATRASITLQSTEGAVFAPGFYLVTVQDKQDPTTNATPLEFATIVASMEATHTVSYTPSVSNTGVLTLGAGKTLGVLDITSESAKTNVYDLGDAGYAQIAADAKPVATITSDTIDANKLISGHTYGLLAGSSLSEATYPQDYFVYNKETADAVDKSIVAAQAMAKNELEKVDALTATVTGSSVTLTPTAKTGMSLDTTNADVYIVSSDDSFNVNGKSVITPASFDETKLTTHAIIATGDMAAAKSLVKNGDVKGKATVVVQLKSGYGYMRSDEMEIDLTLTSLKTDQETMADIAKKIGLTDYNAGIAADVTDDTATLTVSKVGDGIDLPDATKYTISGVSYKMSKYFDAKTGKVTALPEEDITEDVTLTIDDSILPGSTDGVITVSLTIKADSSQPSEKEEAKKAFEEKSLTFQEVANNAMDDEKITTAELTDVLKAYNDMMAAYKAYKAVEA